MITKWEYLISVHFCNNFHVVKIEKNEILTTQDTTFSKFKLVGGFWNNTEKLMISKK